MTAGGTQTLSDKRAYIREQDKLRLVRLAEHDKRSQADTLAILLDRAFAERGLDREGIGEPHREERA